MAEADPSQSFEIPTPARAISDPRLERSKFIDAFAEIENVIAAVMWSAGLEPKLSAPFGQRLDTAAGLPASPEKLKKKIEGYRVELLNLTAIRNVLVHSKMEVLKLVGEREDLICFRHVPFGSGTATLMTCAELRQKTGRLKQISNQMSHLNSPTKNP